MKKKYPKLRAFAVLSGTTIGAGIFALPFVFFRLGFLISFLVLIAVSFFSTFINRTYAKVIEATHGDHQLPGYAGIYLGRWGKRAAFFSLVLGLYGALTAYIVQGGQFFSSVFAVTPTRGSLLFWGLFSAIVVLGLAVASWSGTLISVVLVCLLTALSFFSLSQVSELSINFFSFLSPNSVTLNNILPLVGVVLFAFGGSSAVPEVEEIMRGRKQDLPRLIVGSSLLVTCLYTLFAVSVVLVSGQNTSPAALEGLAENLGGFVRWAAPCIGILALGGSFLLLAYSLREVFFRDFHLTSVVSWFLVLVPPFVFYSLFNLNFIDILSIVGSVGIGLSWFLIFLIYTRI